MNRPYIITLLATMLVWTLASPAADLVPKPLLPVGKSRPSRSSVLLLGQPLSPAIVESVQTSMEDVTTLYRLDQKTETVEQLLGLIKSAEGKRMLARTWHVLVINLSADGDATTQIRTRLEKIDAHIIWREPGQKADAKSLEETLTQALLKNSTPWATLPKDEKRDPAQLLKQDGLLSNPASLPLVPSQTSMVFRAEEGQWQFNLHSYIAHHEGKFWATWSSGRVDEDSSNQFIRYATSKDGLKWSDSGVVAGDPDGEVGPLRWLASGLYVEDGKLYALGCLNEGSDKKGKIWAEAKLVRLQWTKDGWKDLGVFADNCMVYFPPMKVAGRDFFVWRDERAHFFTARSLPGKAQWEVKKHPNFPPDYRMSETSSYADADGTLHLIIRDQAKTRRLYHSLSFDNGDTWTLPVKTNYPDAVSKNMAGRLSNGLYYLINNPMETGRDPLSISVSRDGWTFGSPKNLRVGSPARRYPGGAKNDHSFQYSHAIEHDGKLWVIYATNKEDIEVSAFDIEALVKE
ncbi:BNR repeat protein [Prosthecobacter fusiformis]|uniref:BNR repeat protein n=1 Tax=Prosthecobacter fusiformis TaxID=48464 RepID=A0A4R7SR22_9BACT|nr:exo-alpha-sialidase [Prosthecobacter fusiformis]TDU81722.1 BNR repeat protein [Prosthecobacter fusiformis]